MMAFDRAAKCNAILSPVGRDHVTITVIFEKETGEAVGFLQYGRYPVQFEHVAKDVMYWTCQFLNDMSRARGFITSEDASAAYLNAHDHVAMHSDVVTRGRGCATFGGEP